MKTKEKVGNIDISALNIPPEKHEYETAKFFADRGYNITFIKPSTIKGQHTPDFEMQEKAWEVKCPIKYGKASFEDNLKKATKQSSHIIYDLRRLNNDDSEKYYNELRKWGNIRKIKTLIVITKDGRCLTLYGHFDIIK